MLQDLFQKVRSGIFHIVFFDSGKKRIGSGTAFIVSTYLITNNHVFAAPKCESVWIRQEGQNTINQGVHLSFDEFKKCLVVGSEEGNYDYAILNIPNFPHQLNYNFSFSNPAKSRIGDEICFLGYPLEHRNLSCHKGIISSIYTSNEVNMFQIDASVNKSNSGGPLLDIASGQIIGIVTRKATGLTKLFGELRTTLLSNIPLAKATIGSIVMNGVDVGQAIVANQNQMLRLLDEIERSSNVGIGYAISAEYIMNENCFHAD